MDILFNKTREQCRLIGARGGRAHARNLRLRPAPPPLAVASLPQHLPQNAHQTSLQLDAHFPWLAAAFAPRQARPLRRQ